MHLLTIQLVHHFLQLRYRSLVADDPLPFIMFKVLWASELELFARWFVDRCDGNATNVYSEDLNVIVCQKCCVDDKTRFEENGAAILLMWSFDGQVHPEYLGVVVVDPCVCLQETHNTYQL